MYWLMVLGDWWWISRLYTYWIKYWNLFPTVSCVTTRIISQCSKLCILKQQWIDRAWYTKWHYHKPVNQWQCSFHLKAALPLAKRLVSASCCVSKTMPIPFHQVGLFHRWPASTVPVCFWLPIQTNPVGSLPNDLSINTGFYTCPHQRQKTPAMTVTEYTSVYCK